MRPSVPTPSRRAAAAVERFWALESASGIILLAAAGVAMVWANVDQGSSYQRLWSVPLGPRDLRFWINDGLMTLFFLLIGREIRRELDGGQLGDLRRAALPIVAAAGGMLAPALVYLVFNAGLPTQDGWGIPVATDIAFAVGVLTLLGRRVPPALRVLLLTLAVADDVGAIVVIAVFYTARLSLAGLAVAALGVALVALTRKRGPVFYVLPALVLWAGTLAGGVHPTLAGVVLGLLLPPGGTLERRLHGWVAFGIMPLFALANAGVPIAGLPGGGTRVLVGVGLGLLVGKPLGILAATALARRLGLVALPEGVGWRALLVLGLVAGMGFTMGLFVAALAFPPGPTLETAKIAVLAGSTLAAVAGLAAGRALLR